MKLPVLFICLPLLFLCCTRTENFNARQVVKDHSKWNVIMVQGKSKDTFSAENPQIRFDMKDKTCSGTIRCNSFKSNFLWDWHYMQFGHLTITDNDCADGKSHIQENLLFALQKVYESSLDGDELRLLDDQGNTAVLLRKTE